MLILCVLQIKSKDVNNFLPKKNAKKSNTALYINRQGWERL
jgi:hypothetical protein